MGPHFIPLVLELYTAKACFYGIDHPSKTGKLIVGCHDSISFEIPVHETQISTIKGIISCGFFAAL